MIKLRASRIASYTSLLDNLAQIGAYHGLGILGLRVPGCGTAMRRIGRKKKQEGKQLAIPSYTHL